eukprot:5755251-Pyramimonas_sp.AAC.1
MDDLHLVPLSLDRCLSIYKKLQEEVESRRLAGQIQGQTCRPRPPPALRRNVHGDLRSRNADFIIETHLDHGPAARPD